MDWAVHYAPAQLRYARHPDHEHGAAVTHLLPDDYQAFVAQVGYPVFAYSDEPDGFSFLPPEPMAVLSVDIPDTQLRFPEPGKGRSTQCSLAFFAGHDLSDYEGYGFGPDEHGDTLGVWLIEDGAPAETLGTFTDWLCAELDEHSARISEVDDLQVVHLRQMVEGWAVAGEPADPHRLIEHSLGGSYEQDPYSADDLALTWVGTPGHVELAGTYGLVDCSGSWLIPSSDRFWRVRPFREGVAEVITNRDAAAGNRVWTRIGVDGLVVAD